MPERVLEQRAADLAHLLDADEDPDVAALPLEGVVDAVLAPFESFHQAHPGYFAVLFAPQGSAALASVRGVRARSRTAGRP